MEKNVRKLLVFIISAVSFASFAGSPELDAFAESWRMRGFSLDEVKSRDINSSSCESAPVKCFVSILKPLFIQKDSYIFVTDEVIASEKPAFKDLFVGFEETVFTGLKLAKINLSILSNIKGTRLRIRVFNNVIKSSALWTTEYFEKKKIENINYAAFFDILENKVVHGDPSKETYMAYLMKDMFLVASFYDNSRVAIEKSSEEKEKVSFMSRFGRKYTESREKMTSPLKVKTKLPHKAELSYTNTIAGAKELSDNADDVVLGTMILSDTLYIRLKDFSHFGSYKIILDFLIQGVTKGAKKIVLDLRDNPGGYLVEAQMIADLFLGDDKTVAVTKALKQGVDIIGEEENKAHKTSVKEHFPQPLVVLVNGGSASASELLAQALADHERATLVGDRTYGKGTAQVGIKYDSFYGEKTGTSDLKIYFNTARFYGPKGSTNHIHGLMPHVLVPSKKGPGQEEEDVIRMGDTAFNPVPVVGELPKYRASLKLISCYKLTGAADKMMKSELRYKDYQLFVAFDVLNCLDKKEQFQGAKESIISQVK